MDPIQKKIFKNEIVTYIANHNSPDISDIAAAVQLDINTVNMLLLELKSENRINISKKR